MPEATVIVRQMNEELKGRRIECGTRGNTPHKFAFYSYQPAEYEAVLKGRIIGDVREHGSEILASVGSDHTLVLGGGGERILFYQSERTLPGKHQLLLSLEDNAYLTVSVQGWGNVLLLHRSEMAEHPHVGEGRISVLSSAFTPEYFLGSFEELEDEDARGIKFFLISKPGIWGMGNGYLQDILFHARIHPKRRVVDITGEERRVLYRAIRETLEQAVELGGRDTERDLYNHPGRYSRIMDSKSAGHPCPECGTPIEKVQYLGGACYFCPDCQV